MPGLRVEQHERCAWRPASHTLIDFKRSWAAALLSFSDDFPLCYALGPLDSASSQLTPLVQVVVVVVTFEYWD